MVFSLRDHSGQRFKIGSMLRIGRDPVNEIVLSDTNVSRLHATLSEIQAGLLLRDENSSNGTLVNGVQIKGLVQLQSGDTITIGSMTFVVENTPEPVPAVIPPPAISNQPVYTPPIQSPVPSKPKNKGMIWPLYFIIFIMILCALPPILGAAYYKAPQSQKNEILNRTGRGPASVQVENFADETVFVFATTSLSRTVGDDTFADFEWEIPSFGYNENKELEYGAYRFDFGSQPGEMDLGSCTFYIKGGEVFDFVILPDGILINRTEYPPIKENDPSSAAELDVATSSICKYTPE